MRVPMTPRRPVVTRWLAYLLFLMAAVGAAHAQIAISSSTLVRIYLSTTIKDLTLTNGGSGYTAAPTVAITGGGGSGATATATIANGSVSGFTITNAGSGYTSLPTVTISGGGGTGAAARVVFRSIPSAVSPGTSTPQFAGAFAHSGGAAAKNVGTPSATFSERYPAQKYFLSGTAQPSGVVLVFMRSTIGSSFAAGVPRYNFGDVISPPATDAGGIITAAAGYWRPQPVRVGETFTQTSNPTSSTPIPLVVAAVKVTAGGNSYTSAPTVVFSGGGGSGAAATAVLTQGIVTGVTMTSAGSGYTSLPGIAFSGGGGSGAMAVAESQVVPFYYSPHAQKVFASNAGRVTMTWVTGVPVAMGTDSALLYRYKEEIFSVSSGSSLPIRKIFWSERSFTGPPVAVPSGKIETINPVYSANFPATVAQEYQAVGVTAPVVESAALPAERRTFWFDKIAGIGQLHAYNLEGRILIEYLGALKTDGGGVHEFLGADIVDVVRVPEPITTTVVLGEQLTPRDEDNKLLPLDLSSEWVPSPVQSASSDAQAYFGTVTRKDSKRVYYAERENLNAERVAFYWLEQNDAAIHFLTSPAKPELGILWPKIKSHYLQVWPTDLASFAHNTTPTGGSTAAAGVRFPGGQVPQIIFQDDLAQTEATVDTSTQSLLVTSPWDGLSRTLLKFTAANEVWYVRLYTQNAARPGFQEGDSLSAINVAATVGTRIDAPAGHEVGGYIASGTGYLPSAYRDPFSVGMDTAAKGAIIPVNAVPGNDSLQVWWFKKVAPASASFQPFYVPAKVGNYTLSYPAVPSTLVLASNAGTGDLTSAEIAGSLYVQNERSLPGFNPNEEHAVVLGGRAYALRDDLNNTTAVATAYTSQPFVLLAYTSAIDGRPAMRAWKVLREVDEALDADDILFKYPVTAGTILQAPMPLPLLPLPIDPATNKVKNKEVAGIADSSPNGTAPAHYASFTFKDRKGYDWVYRGPHGGMPLNAISLVSRGAGYTSAPTVSLSGGGGTGAAATATLSSGRITAITLTKNGSGYTSAPTVTLSTSGSTSQAKASAAVGPTLGMQYYYALQAGFYLPGLTTQPAVGTIVPYLRPLSGGVPQGDAVTGTPLTIVYTPVWPTTAAELRIAETLTLPKYGLPAVMNQRSAHVLYEQSVALQGTTKASVSLFDPLREKTFALGAAGKLAALPTSILSSTSQGKTYFQGLPPHLQSRFYYDPTYGTTGALVLKGTFVDEVAGEDFLHLNVLSADDVTALNALPSSTDANRQLWLSAISELATKVETFVQDPNKAGSFIASATPVTVGGTALATVTNADTAVVNYALTATGLASGWVTMIFGNGLAFTPTGEPVSVQVIKVAPTLNTGELKQLYSSNPLDEQVSLRHSADFAGNPGAYDFEWRYAPPQNGVAPSTYTYTYTSRFGNSWNVAQNPAAALPTSTEYGTATVTLPRNVTIKNATYSGDPARPGLVVRSAAGVDFTAGVPVSILFSADLSDTYAGFVLYINGAAALAYNAPAAFSSTLASSGLVPAGVSPAGLARQFAIEGNYFKAAVNTIEVAVFSTGDAGLSSNLNFSLHASAETDMVAAVGSPWQTPNGTLSNQVVVGGSATSPLGSPLLVMSDNYFTMRYRPKINTGNILATGTSQTTVAWSRWMPPKLVEGWIKRVLAGINPFNQRVTDLYNNSVNTDVSLLTQAGKRWEGNVPLSLANIDSFGLIEIYETVLNRGKTISIDSGYDYAPANDALLLAAGYLNDLYTLLGNEAYADAANPTISVDGGTTSTEVNTSRFAFESQVKSVLDEELALLRGRDDFLAPGITVTPAYNRLYWNFTRGINSGEALYAANYNIREKSGSPTSDGKIDAADAQRMFPQGHGDAYGHYLTALKGYTRLLQSSNFTWTPRSEAVTVLGQTVQVDYFDERKFATAAVNIARTAQQVIALTHRQSYTDDTAAGWTHLSDGKYNASTGVTRYWGAVEWSARATQGTYFNWLIGNSILPDKDLNPQNNGVQVVDRTTVPELPELTTLGEALQSKVDSINARLNPLSLSPNAVAFDISPTELKAGKSHFDQIYERSLQAVTNAKGAFDQAARMTRLLRNQENQVSDTTSAIVDQENAYARRLIDLYGTPYPFEIGAGKVYAQDYTGPDLLEWFIIDRPHDSSGGLINSATTLTLSLKVPTEVATFTGFALEDITKHYEEKYTTRSITIDPAKSVQYSDVWASGAAMGQRSVTGRLQQALADADQARMALQLAADRVQNSYESFKRRRELALAMVQAHTDSVAESDASGEKIGKLRQTQVALELSAEALRLLGDSIFDLGTSFAEIPPFVVGVAVDATSVMRGSIIMGAAVAKSLSYAGAFAFEVPAKLLEIEQENLEGAMQDAIAEFAFSYEQAQVVYEYELAMRELSTGFYQVAMHANTLQRANENARNLQAEGLALQAERETFRQRAAAKIQGYRTNDITFRTFRNEALEQYRSLYDLASRYTYLAAKAYDYETGLLGSTAGKSVINAIVASRSLGDLTGGIPQATVSTFGDSGLAGTMARLQADWAVAKPRLGINSPDQNGTLFSLRRELYRLVDGTGGDPAWQQTLEQNIMSNIMADADVAAACRNLRNADGSAVPGIVIAFSTVVQDTLNFFGRPLAASDHTFSPSNFATKIYSVGIVFPGYVGMDPYRVGVVNAGSPSYSAANALSATPYVYLIPTGADYMLAPPLGDVGTVREFKVSDQALPLPFNLGATAFSSVQYFDANGTLSEQPWVLRKHQAFRPVNDAAFFYSSVPAEFTNNRLVGRSVWNSGWKIVIPAKTLSSSTDALNRFVASVKDIELFLRTYSHAGN